jgi:hypothetical protein
VAASKKSVPSETQPGHRARRPWRSWTSSLPATLPGRVSRSVSDARNSMASSSPNQQMPRAKILRVLCRWIAS